MDSTISPSDMAAPTANSPRQFRREAPAINQRLNGSAELKSQALAAMREAGYEFDELITNTTKFQRHPKTKAIWYRADEGTSDQGNPWLEVCAGDYRETGGEPHSTFVWLSWEKSDIKLSDQERQQREQAMEQARIQREAERQAEREEGATRARQRWQAGRSVPEQYEHPALARRSVKAYGLRLDADGKTLLCGATDISGALVGIEEMYHQEHPGKGWKATMYQCSLTGAFHAIGPESSTVYICEGYSTGASIHEATGKRVYCAFAAYNVVHVAEAVKLANPGLKIIIAGDDDRHQDKNAGRMAAEKAAQKIRTWAVFPTFKDLTGNPTDWNDLARLEGLDEVKRQLEAVGTNRLKPVDIRDLMAMELPPRENIIEPWFPSQGLAMLYAKTGIGKTHVALEIAYQLSIGGRVFHWEVPKPISTLYMDGEMPANAMQQRIANIALANGKEPIARFSVLNQDLIEGGMPDIGSRQGQQELEPLVKDYQLIVVDNISTLCRTGAENKADDWMLMQEWALHLRAKGKSVLFVHHAGKGGDQRGTSKRSDVLDTVIELRRPTDYEHSQGARFEIHFQKARGCMGDAVKPIEVCLEQNQDAGTSWTVKTLEESLFLKVVDLSNDGLKQYEIAQELNTSKGTVSKYLKKARSQGLITSDGGQS